MQPIDILISTDDTGSVHAVTGVIQRNIKQMLEELFASIPDLHIGLMIHKDYCDRWSSFTLVREHLTDDKAKLIRFLNKYGGVGEGGGDNPECYELAMREAQSDLWRSDAKRIMILIGDDVPHTAYEDQNYLHLDWQQEAYRLYNTYGIQGYAVQALNRSWATGFYGKFAEITHGLKFSLDQFHEIIDLIKGICYQQQGPAALTNFIDQVQTSGKGISRCQMENYRILGGHIVFADTKRAARYADVDLTAVPPGRFQMLNVIEDCRIKAFVESNGILYTAKRGFYEFTKSEKIQPQKEIILQDRVTLDLFQGKRAKEIAQIQDKSGRQKPSKEILDKYIIYVRSDSYTRVLKAGTKFLYEVHKER